MNLSIGVYQMAWLVILVSFLLSLIYYIIKRFSEEKREQDIDAFNEVLDKTGFLYDQDKEIFYSAKNAWQRKFGYCELYDEAAPPLGMVIDCEPISFTYGGKSWLIEIWKGQYGLCTGAEIGIYSAKKNGIHLPDGLNSTFYGETEEVLPMRIELIRRQVVIMKLDMPHWWLAGVVPGEFSRPEELAVRAGITFYDGRMLRAFVGALTKLSYRPGEYEVLGNTVYILYTKPHSPQPATRGGVIERLALENNENMCKLYQEAAGGAGGVREKLSCIRREHPEVYRAFIMGLRHEDGYAAYKTLKDSVRGV